MPSTTQLESPVGVLTLLAEDGTLTGLYMERQRYAPSRDDTWREDRSVLALVVEELEAYFARELTEFTAKVKGRGTRFQLEVWHQLSQIPYGTTISYGELAKRVNRPGAARAVGSANGHNPVGIIVPCHRVIGADGSLTGYGGGLPRKTWLLAHESGSLFPEAMAVHDSPAAVRVARPTS